jgi:HlyD family secretion protein
MIFKRIIPVLAVVGMAGALFMVQRGQQNDVGAQPLAEPATAPYTSYVSGSGLIEAPTANISVATAVAGIVTSVEVKVGDRVKRGQPLFRLDERAKVAEIERQKAALALARLRVAKLERGTRPEELASQQAQVSQARVSLEDARQQLALRESIQDPRALSRDELLQQSASVRLKEEQLQYAQRQLKLLEAGTWQPDIDISKADIESAQLQIRQLEIDLERLVVRAPVEGEILQLNIHPGEFATPGGAGSPLVLLGETRSLYIRAEVDENDAWRIARGARATAYPRGQRDLSIPLRFVRFEPYVGAKRNLTGGSTERVDTRVLPVIYEFASPAQRLYIGQQLDVMIEAKPLADPGKKS